ncbi:MAG: HypC/HybG/HupF family hydrogenase formation chaperone [Myxococcota bacterium]
MCLGIPGEIVEIADREKRLGVVDVSGVRRTVNLACVINEDHPIDSCVGDWVLVHVGFAMSRIDPEEAQRTLELMHELGEVAEAHEAMRQTPELPS